ncbi:MAG: preprotein translocase subunit SecY [Candidatus Paceibacterota bacterium]
MNSITEKLKLIFGDKTLRMRIIFTLVGLAIFRALASIPIPGINKIALANFFQNNQFFGMLNVFSGGGLSNLSLVMLGVGPYITASIIMQLLTMMSEKLKAIYQEEGEIGRRKFSQWTRLASIPLSALQAFGFMILLSKQGVLTSLTTSDFIINIIVITAGSTLLMWIGELITEFGIGNGTSLIIFAGIIASAPTSIGRLFFSYDASQLPLYVGLAVAAAVVIYSVVFITEAERPIPVTYAKRVRGNKMFGGISTYLPLRLNQAGVIPIIFALSLLLFPQLILNFIKGASTGVISNVANVLLGWLADNWIYGIMYFLFVFVFTYFYTAVTFDPKMISENLQKSGAFIPGIRPGQATAEYLGKVTTRITLVGALFLGVIAVLPLFIKAVTGITSIAIGGTALLIVVSVVIDLIKKIDAQISMREY